VKPNVVSAYDGGTLTLLGKMAALGLVLLTLFSRKAPHR
jgi:hypothetical protein